MPFCRLAVATSQSVGPAPYRRRWRPDVGRAGAFETTEFSLTPRDRVDYNLAYSPLKVSHGPYPF